MDQRARRTPARFLGPLALIAVIVVFLAIISGSGNGGGSSSTTSSTTAQTTATSAKKSSTPKAHKKTTASGATVYIVKVGDTLGAIAAKTGVPLATIQSLNPNVDPHAMIAGQHIRLK